MYIQVTYAYTDIDAYTHKIDIFSKMYSEILKTFTHMIYQC